MAALFRRFSRKSKADRPAEFDVTKVFTATLEAVTPSDVEESKLLWSVKPSASLFHNKAAESATIDVFVSHVWYDVVYASWDGAAGRDQVGYYMQLKSEGVRKAAEQLEGRVKLSEAGTTTLAALPKEKAEWRVWMDHVSVDQSSMQHKVHVVAHFTDIIADSNALIVLLSPTYFSRLWCLFEMTSFIALKDLTQIASYCWAFMDGGPALIASYVDGLKALSVANSKCLVDADRATLRAKVAELYVDEQAWTRFAQLSGLALLLQSLLLSPAVYSADRVEYFVKPFLDVCAELGFDDLRDAFASFPAVERYAELAQAGSSETSNADYTNAVLAHVTMHVMPVVRAASKAALLEAPPSG